MLSALDTFEHDNKIQEFENGLLAELAKFNNIHFPGYDFKYKIIKVILTKRNSLSKKSASFCLYIRNYLKSMRSN